MHSWHIVTKIFFQVQQLTQENLDLKARVADLERLIDPQTLENFDKNKQVRNTYDFKCGWDDTPSLEWLKFHAS